MKKSIFLSVLALAAVVSCQKSEIVDTKFNDAIGFETYVGRDAMTKASVADETSLQSTGFGVYGYYTATADYTDGNVANLMSKQEVTYTPGAEGAAGTWGYTPAKYWTNGSDKYTFFAYAPYSLTSESAPTVAYTVSNTISEQIDVLYSNNNMDITKRESVAFKFEHALARITVKAKSVMTPKTANGTDYDNTFHVKEITLKGEFNTTGTLTLGKVETKTVDGQTVKDAVAKWDATVGTGGNYNFFTTTDKAVIADDPATTDVVEKPNYLTATDTNYGTIKEKNYLMVIPTNMVSNPATLVVKYSVVSAGTESSVMTKELEIAQDFVMGNAYTINLEFALDPKNQIKFSVDSVEGWSETAATIVKPSTFEESEAANNPELYPNKTN